MFTLLDSVPAGDWRVDADKSRVTFETKMFGFLPVRGRFDRFNGRLLVDERGNVEGELVVDAETIRTGITRRDRHLRTADFFHARSHPHMKFVLRGLTTDGTTPELTGALEIRGKELPIKTSIRVHDADGELRLETRCSVDHQGAGLGWAKPLMIQKHVTADVALTLHRNTT